MLGLNRLPEFYREYRSVEVVWNRSEAAAQLSFAYGLMFSCLLVTPFWTAVGLFVHHLTK
jgi:hypothetical protein